MRDILDWTRTLGPMGYAVLMRVMQMNVDDLHEAMKKVDDPKDRLMYQMLWCMERMEIRAALERICNDQARVDAIIAAGGSDKHIVLGEDGSVEAADASRFDEIPKRAVDEWGTTRPFPNPPFGPPNP